MQHKAVKAKTKFFLCVCVYTFESFSSVVTVVEFFCFVPTTFMFPVTTTKTYSISVTCI